jgi:hypothetical protein
MEMGNSPIDSLIDLLAVSGHSKFDLKRVVLQQGGHIIIPVEYLGFVGGNLSQIATDQFGRLIYRNVVVSPLLACGHITKSINEIAGTCFVCKRLICDRCLVSCDLTGAPVCPMHSTVKDGVVIGDHAKKGLLWRVKVQKVRQEKELGLDVRKQIPYK